MIEYVADPHAGLQPRVVIEPQATLLCQQPKNDGKFYTCHAVIPEAPLTHLFRFVDGLSVGLIFSAVVLVTVRWLRRER